MTFDEIVGVICDRLNLTSDAAIERVGERVNERYRRVTSAIGLVARRVVSNITINPSTTASLPDYTVDGMELVTKVLRVPSSGSSTIIPRVLYDEIDNLETRNAEPRTWALNRVGNNHCIITFDGYPSDPVATFTVRIEGYDIAENLQGAMEPKFPISYHDILIEGGMADELAKMEKFEASELREKKFYNRLSDLRMFIAESGYMDIYQGKLVSNDPWQRRFFGDLR